MPHSDSLTEEINPHGAWEGAKRARRGKEIFHVVRNVLVVALGLYLSSKYLDFPVAGADFTKLTVEQGLVLAGLFTLVTVGGFMTGRFAGSKHYKDIVGQGEIARQAYNRLPTMEEKHGLKRE